MRFPSLPLCYLVNKKIICIMLVRNVNFFVPVDELVYKLDMDGRQFSAE